MSPIETAFKVFTDRTGLPLDLGKVYLGLPNQNPVTAPLPVFWDAAGTQPALQPLPVVNGYIVRAGTPANVFIDGAYSELVVDSKGQQVFYARNSNEFSVAAAVASLSENTGAEGIGFAPFGDIASTNVQDAIEEVVADYTTGDGGKIGTTKPYGTSSTLSADLAVIYPGARKSLADVIAKLHGGAAITIACYGDSLTYGQDTSANGQPTYINGSTTLRSRYPYPETLATAMNLNSFAAATTVYNRGFPGDTAADGLARWGGASATDVAILAYGTNDGKVLAVPVETFKKNMAKMIEREFQKGAVVILSLAPLVNDFATNANISPYTVALRQLGEEYNVWVVDIKEQLAGLRNIWAEPADLSHLNSYAYAEWGWHLSALFINRDAGMRSISAGTIFYPSDQVGYGGALVANAAARNGSFIEIAPGARHIVCGYFDDDVLPVIHSFNSSGSNVQLTAQYAGNGSYRGLVGAELVHVAAVSQRQTLTTNVLRRGYRTLLILNSGAQTAYVEAIEFADLSQVALAQGLLAKSTALSGVHQSIRHTAALGTFWTAIDNSKPLTAPYVFSARVTMSGLAGIAVFKNRAGQLLLSDILFVLRSGNDLILREVVGGVVTNTTLGGVAAFAAGPFAGEISIELTTADVKVYLDGVLKITKASPSNTFGFPGLMSDNASGAMLCHGAQVSGYVKNPYGVTP